MGQHWVPDGNGGFIEAGGDGSLVTILFMPIIIMTFSLLPLVVFSLIVTIPLLSVIAGFLTLAVSSLPTCYLISSIIVTFGYSTIFAIAYWISWKKMSVQKRIVWLLIGIVFVLSPLFMGMFLFSV